MVARVRGYYRTGFKGARRVTQGDPLSPTIFNVVVYAVVCHWVTLAVEEAETRGERRREGRHQATLFYADDGMVASSDPRWLQWDFNTLVGLFDRVGLHTNVGKTVSMICRPCPTAGNQSEVAYGRKMTGERRSIERGKESGSSAGTAGRGWRQGRWKHIGWYSIGKPRQKGELGPTQRWEKGGNRPSIG